MIAPDGQAPGQERQARQARARRATMARPAGRRPRGRTPYSDETAKPIDMEVGCIISECQEEAKRLLGEHGPQLDALVAVPMKRERSRRRRFSKPPSCPRPCPTARGAGRSCGSDEQRDALQRVPTASWRPADRRDNRRPLGQPSFRHDCPDVRCLLHPRLSRRAMMAPRMTRP